MIARCIRRMRSGACATCDNRAYCPAGRSQQAFGPPKGVQSEESGLPKLFSFLGAFVQSLAADGSAGQPRCFRAEVEQVMEPLLGTAAISIERVASTMGMSRQTLYRRLKEQGTSFEEILEAKRRQLAIRYLATERASVKATAYRLGFSDPAAFSRAFKRWTGCSPRDFRDAPAFS